MMTGFLSRSLNGSGSPPLTESWESEKQSLGRCPDRKRANPFGRDFCNGSEAAINVIKETSSGFDALAEAKGCPDVVY
jgi:hypothetical protein